MGLHDVQLRGRFEELWLQCHNAYIRIYLYNGVRRLTVHLQEIGTYVKDSFYKAAV